MPRSARTASLAASIVERLAQAYPGATTELAYRNPFELLVATILSAQSTDARVNAVTPALFARFPDAASLAAAPLAEVERLIKPTGFFRTKARAIVGMARQLVERHGGQVPASMEALVALPGVGRKTASVVLGHALGVPALPVDRHVLRVAGRLGIARGTTPDAVEAELRAALPAHLWTLASDCLILHGRRVCRPRPLCERCMVSSMCAFYRRGGPRPSPGRRSPARPAAATRARRQAGRPAASPRRGRKSR
jgi:endonuclease-3